MKGTMRKTKKKLRIKKRNNGDYDKKTGTFYFSSHKNFIKDINRRFKKIDIIGKEYGKE